MKRRVDPSDFNPEKFLKKDAAKHSGHPGMLSVAELMPIGWSRKFKADFITRLAQAVPAALYAGRDMKRVRAALSALETAVAGELKNLGIAQDSALVRMLAWGCLADPRYRRAALAAKPPH